MLIRYKARFFDRDLELVKEGFFTFKEIKNIAETNLFSADVWDINSDHFLGSFIEQNKMILWSKSYHGEPLTKMLEKSETHT